MTITKSGLYYPNKLGRLYIKAIEETLGTEAMNVVQQLSGVPQEHYPPPNNFAKAFDFAYLGAIGMAIETLYGIRGERAVGRQVGKTSFAGGLAEYGATVGVSDLAFKAIPLKIKLKIGLNAMAQTFSKFSDQVTEIEEMDDYFIYAIRLCPVCWGRSSESAVCYSAVSMVEAGLHWVSNGKSFRIEEVACRAMGHEACLIHIYKEPLN